MEYNICSNDSNLNKIIIDTLKNLDNTFFVECLDSESDEEPNILLDIESISNNNDEIPISILNEFSFVDILDNYIEDKIYDELKLKVQQFFEKNECSYYSKLSCFRQIGYEKFLARQVEFESLDKNIHDIVIKGQLIAF
ncbi:5101_t:CDS:1 [Scutellospora calospora]|uniref:5101_t:CDS:1 n=1 Tax=Scutellospora calospora TaxID=85575 RepID=A0ACA9MB95_9GLOM|nr:5101_t:CDS:1 [Scutellospora calospora]